MSQDKPDDLTPRDATILRPRPGAGRRPGPVAGAGQAPPSGGQASAPGAAPWPAADGQGSAPSSAPWSSAAPAAAPPPPTASFAPLADFSQASTNPLVQAAVPLLVLAGRLRGQIANADIESLRRQAIQEMRSFEDRARQADVPPEDVLAARYALCTVLDEAVLNTPWGADGNWSNQSLLVTFHREAAGGEKFFQILERVSSEPQRYLVLLELLYVCLALGFEGKYRLDDRGAARLAEIRETLYRRIEGLRESVETELSPRWKGVEDRRNAVMRFVPLWIVASACLVLLVGSYIYFDSRLSTRAEPVSAQLARVGLESLDPVAPPPVGTPTSGLRELLATQIASGRISVEESGERTLITITATDLFASGSASINQSYETLVHEVASALNSVPGRILVIGHTDDQALRSLRFKDNYELSRARAVQVANLIRGFVTDGSRIEAAGKGALEPRYLPADAPANRARNRRVEIIHRRAG
ncbi:MAG TPA: type IVB secretion system protein IcmH/DotU [Steroidobacteraceae bacterium]|nr:type IVB secretion system protein IcmH/DotU [Steroidobacteraceae bacterium]